MNKQFPAISFGKKRAALANWREQDDGPDDDIELAKTPPDVIAMLGFDPLTVSLSNDSAGPTMEMTEAGYISGPVKRQPCNLCSMWLGKNRCSLVIGDISPRGHCDHFDATKTLEFIELLERADRL